MARSLVVNILSDASKFDKGINQAERSTQKFEGSVKKADTTVSKFDGRVAAARNTLQTFGKLALAGAGAAIVKFGIDAVKAASDLGESVNAVEQTFESAADTILDFSKNASEAVGLSSRAFNELVTPIGALLRNFGFSAQEAADKTVVLAQRAADLASVFNVDVSEALGAVSAALRGEGDPIERFGANVSAARVEAFALAEGLVETKSEIDDNVKVMGRLGLILQDTERFAGDFVDTADSAANASKRLSGAWEDFMAAIGSAGTAPAADFINFLIDALFTVETIINKLSFDNVERDLGAAALRAKELRREIGGITADNRVAAFGFLLRDTTVDFEDLTEAGQSFIETEEDLMEATEGTADEIRLLAEETGITSNELQDLADGGAAALAAAFGITRNEAENLIPILQLVAGELQVQEGIDAYAERLTALAGYYGETAAGARDAAGANDELAGSFLAVLEARRELISPLFAAAKSQQRKTDARDSLAEIRKDDEATVEDIARAELDLLEATLEADVATEEFARTFRASYDEADELAKDLNVDLIELLDTLGLLKDLAPVDLQIVLDLVGNLGANFNPEDDPRNFPRSDRPETTASDPSVTGVFIDGRRASGGPVTGGRSYLVGERGPELFTPGASGSISPNGAFGGAVVFNNFFSLDASRADFAASAIRKLDEQLGRYRRGLV